MGGHAAELRKGVVDPWRGGEAGSWEGLDGDVEAVKLERAEGAVVEAVCVEGFLAEGGVDEWWHFLEGGIGWWEWWFGGGDGRWVMGDDEVQCWFGLGWC